MNSFAAVGSAIYGRLGTVVYTYNVGGTATVTGTLGTYDSLSAQGAATPYVIFQLQTSVDEYAFGAEHGESLDVVLKSVTNRQWASQQGFTIYDTAHHALQDAPLMVSGADLLRCRRQSRLQYRDRDGYWHVGGVYRLDFWET